MSTFRLYFQALFWALFLKVFLELECNGKKDRFAVFGCNNDRLFPEKDTVKDHISKTKLEKGDGYYTQTRHNDIFSHYILILRKLQEKMSRKALVQTNKMCSCPLGIL